MRECMVQEDEREHDSGSFFVRQRLGEGAIARALAGAARILFGRMLQARLHEPKELVGE